MKTLLSSRGRAFAFALVGAVGLIAPQAVTQAPTGLQRVSHAPIGVHRDENGNVKYSVRNEVETSNWSGYAIANFETGALYTSAQVTWKVPTAKYAVPPPTCHTYRFGSRSYQYCSSSRPSAEYSSTWVGIGGYCENANCTTVDNTLIQLGTEQDVSSNGTTQYYAWIEMLPANESPLSTKTYPVKPGDTITASLTCTANCTPGATQTWNLKMTSSEGWTYSTNVSYASSLLSAVWIQEAPSSSSGVLPLANYGTVTLDPTVGSSANLGFTSTNSILMVDPYGETSNPSNPESTTLDVFSTCWGNNPNSIAACPAP